MENEYFKTSTQFRLWTFPRKQFNEARSRIIDKALSNLPPPTASTPPALTTEDLDQYHRYILYATYTLATKTFQLPSNVTYTCLIYLHRFYLSHNPLTYPPQSIIPTVIFITTKTENYYISLTSFIKRLEETDPRWKCTKEELLAPEFVISIGLKWCFDIRQPFRSLEGFVYELFDLIRTTEDKNVDTPHTSPYLPPNPTEFPAGQTPTNFFWLTLTGELASAGLGRDAVEEKTIIEIHSFARYMLRMEVAFHPSLTFRFTPPQLAMGAFAVKPIGKALIKSYLSLKQPLNPDNVTKMMDVITVVAKEIREMGKIVCAEFRDKKDWEDGFKELVDKVDGWREVSGKIDFVERDRQRKMQQDGLEKTTKRKVSSAKDDDVFGGPDLPRKRQEL